MPIAYTLKSFDTSPISEISNLTELTDIRIDDIKFDQSVGDEMWLESGELTIETFSAITAADWIALYINDILAEVFSFRQVKYDEKRGKYTYNLYPIQKTFMDDLAETLINHSADTEDWCYDLPDSEVTIASFDVLDGDGVTQSGTDISGYQPLRMVKAMVGKSQRIGYHIFAANFDGASITDSAIKGTLIRGTGVLTSDTDQNKINGTFSTDGTNDFDVNWMQIFKLLVYSYNAFIKVTPVIVSGSPDKLGIIIDITPRIYVTAGTAITDVIFSERVLINNKYKISGVLISGRNFEYKQRNWDSPAALNRDVDVYDYTIPEPDYAIALYYRGWTSSLPFFDGGWPVADYYTDIISTGHGYEGKCQIVYNDGSEKILTVLDQVSFDGTTIMLTRLSLGMGSLADYEGIII